MQQKPAAFLIKRLAVLIILAVASVFLARAVYVLGLAQSLDSSAQERKLKTKEFKEMPLVVTEVRNLQSETWHKDLQIEVKNVSKKRIYSILAFLVFDDIKVSGGESAIHLVYGDPKNGLIRALADGQDLHLEPGETYVFTIPEMYKKGLKAKHEKFPELTKNLIIRFARISFGDGTGFEVGRPRDYKNKGFKPTATRREELQEDKMELNIELHPSTKRMRWS
jgi:hypothetical protein